MLDVETTKIFSLLSEVAGDGRYKVITTKEIITLLPDNLKISEDAVRESVRLLSEKEFIKVKYEDDNEFCLCTLPKGRLFCENKNDEEVEDFLRKKSYFVISFMGAFCGGALVALIVAVIRLFIK